ncbi:UDP-glucose 4-epimerase GalE [Pseudopelagicola sp. nBUS_20]|uniref:UDP-glucose 4-epimerase GalE n=1 Tax=Pseudopelagicola sp. nBUS_20 TaxID=3395317 RepID=UPI003EB77E50
MTTQPLILITGGAGFIGSHVAVELLSVGYNVLIYDNFENAASDVPDRITKITGAQATVVRGDVRDRPLISETLARYKPDLVMHFAGKKAVGESVAKPLFYYEANIGGGICLLTAMSENNIGKLVFSSSATVYKFVDGKRLTENAPTCPTNPYGRTKLMLEDIVSDAVTAGALQGAISLRYFNPVGAHSSGLIGEEPRNKPNNLFPFIAQTAAGLQETVPVFGNNYKTPDGTGVRDYIHVVDLARGHLAAANYLLDRKDTGEHQRINLGTGFGYSVMQALSAFSSACGFEIPHKILPRRPGDVATCIADPELANRLLSWRAESSLDRMCVDHWRFQSKNDSR